MFRKELVAFLRSKQTIFLLLILFFSFVIRIGFLAFYTGDSSYSGINLAPWSSADDGRYEKVALSLIKSDLFGVIKDYPILQGHLLYPFFIAAIYSIFGHHFFMVRIIQAFLSSLTCILTFFIGEKIFNKKIGIMSSIYSSVYPLFIYLNGRFISETLFIFLLSIAILFFIKIYKKPTTMNAIWAGIFLGLCILTRSMLLGFIPFLLFWIFMILKEKKKIAVISLSLLISLTIIIIPWIILKVAVKCPDPEGAGHVLWIWNNPYTDGSYYIASQELRNNDKYKDLALSLKKSDKELMQLAVDYIKHNPTKFLKGMWYRFIRFWNFDSQSIRPTEHSRYRLVGFLSYGLLLPFIILGICISFKEWREFVVLYLLIFYFMIVCSVLSSGTRQRAPVDPYLIMFAMLGLDYLIAKLPLLPKIRKLFELTEPNA